MIGSLNPCDGNGDGRLQTTQDWDNGTTSYEYDADGRLPSSPHPSPPHPPTPLSLLDHHAIMNADV
ncbi:MAG: hypothetical protein GY796_16170 [Chloroflexi bacterium]|nr:hypothetical protein [Chloroflexota bacterium]